MVCALLVPINSIKSIIAEVSATTTPPSANTDKAALDAALEADILAELNDYEMVGGEDGKTSEQWEQEISDLLDES